MTKKGKLAKPAPPKPSPWDEMERAQLAVVERLCAELGIDRAELFRRAQERLRYARQRFKERLKGQPSLRSDA